MENLFLMDDRELFKELSMSNDITIRNLIFEKYEKLVYFICSKLVEGCVDEDMAQEGHMVLLKCIKSYDMNKGASFKTFAYNRILRHLKNFKIQNINYNGKFSRRKSIQLSIFNKREELEKLGIINGNDKMNKEEMVEFNKLKNFAFPINADILKENEDGSGEYLKDILIDGECEIDRYIFEEDLSNILSKRQLKIIKLIKEGFKIKDIQKELGIKKRAVFYAIKTIKNKINEYSYE